MCTARSVCTGKVLGLKRIRSDSNTAVIKYSRCQIMAAMESAISHRLHTGRQRYHGQITVVGKCICRDIVNMIRSDGIRDIQCLNAGSYAGIKQLVGGIYYKRRTTRFI